MNVRDEINNRIFFKYLLSLLSCMVSCFKVYEAKLAVCPDNDVYHQNLSLIGKILILEKLQFSLRKNELRNIFFLLARSTNV